MDNVRSLYLELLRIFAAFFVFILHVATEKIEGKPYFSNTEFITKIGLNKGSAHLFVIIFFVLSGFLISMSANKPGMTFQSFITARLGRLYSVLLPALLFSFLVAFILIQFSFIPEVQIQSYNDLLPRFLLNITFLSQSWMLCSTPPLNNPFWSVNYEFMYYLMIGAFLFKKTVVKWVFVFFVILISGPKVLLLAPAWFIGNLLFKLQLKKLMPFNLSLIVFIMSFVLIIMFIHNPLLLPLTKDIGDNMVLGIPALFSWNYQADFIFSILVALNIYSFFGISSRLLETFSVTFTDKVLSNVRTIGNCSYTLYLFHLPLLFLFVSILPFERANDMHVIGLIILVLVSVYFIARVTEWKIEFWRSQVEKGMYRGLRLFSQVQKFLIKG